MKKKMKSSSVKRSVASKSSKKSWWSKLPFMTKLSIFGLAILGIALAVSIPYLSQSESVGDTRSRAAENVNCIKLTTTTTNQPARSCPEGYPILKCFGNYTAAASGAPASCTQWGCCPQSGSGGQGGGEGGGGDEGGGLPGGGGGAPSSGGSPGGCAYGVIIDPVTHTVSCRDGGDNGDTGGGGGGDGGGDIVHQVVDKVLPHLSQNQIPTFCAAGDAVVEAYGYPEEKADIRQFKSHLKEYKDDLGKIWNKVLTFRSAQTLKHWYDTFCIGEE